MTIITGQFIRQTYLDVHNRNPCHGILMNFKVHRQRDLSSQGRYEDGAILQSLPFLLLILHFSILVSVLVQLFPLTMIIINTRLRHVAQCTGREIIFLLMLPGKVSRVFVIGLD